MAYVHIDIEDHLDEVDEEVLRSELAKRDKKKTGNPIGEFTPMQLLERAYYEMRGKCDSNALREYFFTVLGKII